MISLEEAIQEQHPYEGILSIIRHGIIDMEYFTKRWNTINDPESSFRFVFYVHSKTPRHALIYRFFCARWCLFGKTSYWRAGAGWPRISDCIVKPLYICLVNDAHTFVSWCVSAEDVWFRKLAMCANGPKESQGRPTIEVMDRIFWSSKPLSSTSWLNRKTTQTLRCPASYQLVCYWFTQDTSKHTQMLTCP